MLSRSEISKRHHDFQFTLQTPRHNVAGLSVNALMQKGSEHPRKMKGLCLPCTRLAGLKPLLMSDQAYMPVSTFTLHGHPQKQPLARAARLP